MNLNTGTAWSELDLADLRQSMKAGDSIERIALCRDIEEVRQKVAEIDASYPGAALGHPPA